MHRLIVVFAAGGAMVTPNLLSAISLTSKKDTGRNISTQSSTNSIGQILDPVLGTWLIAGSIVLVAIAFLYFFKNPHKKIYHIVIVRLKNQDRFAVSPEISGKNKDLIVTN